MDKYILVQYPCTLNTVITQTFKSTQRIKLTSFDISENYVVFGASSGGIYIFKREPCEFLKLIPSKEGSATKIVIGSNERNMGIASSKGLVVILENFLDSNLTPLINSEHEGNVVTAMKWYGNDVYTGDNLGKISVFSLNNLLTIFQTPSAAIMHLDSTIVQIDTYLNYLLISTQTRTYLCDTEKEQYKQIGKKARDGNFGACFFNVPNNDSLDMHLSLRGKFKTITEDENFVTALNSSDIKIYCARPGARLWEANFEPTVLVTHQFRDSLNQRPSDILHLIDELDATLNISTFKNTDEVPTNFNFGKIYPISSRFIVTYDSKAIYFFDPKTSSLMFWNNSFGNIKDIKMLNSCIYIWHDDLKIEVISLTLLDEVVVKTLLKKQYFLCAELCVHYMEDVINLIEYSRNIHLISALRTKLIEIQATELLEKIKPILLVLEEYNRKQTMGKKLASGIVLIENTHVNHNLEDYDMYMPESVQNFKNVASNVTAILNNSTKAIKETFENLETTVKNISINKLQSNPNSNKVERPAIQQLGSQQSDSEDNTNFVSLYKQYQLNKTHKGAELTESSNLLHKLNLDDTLVLFQNFIKYVDKLSNEDATTWCKEQFLKQASKKRSNIKQLDKNTSRFLRESFLELNRSDNLRCHCNFPLPKAHKKPPDHCELGATLLDDSEDIGIFLDNVPYLYKYKLSRINNLNDVLLNLPLIVQFSDKDLFEQFMAMFTYDTWDEIIKLIIKLKQEICLNCGEKIDIDGTWSWSNLGILMIQSIGPQNASRLLKRYSQHIPDGELDSKYYQCCILASTVDPPGLAANFMEKVVTESTTQKFEDLMEKFLQRKYLGQQQLPQNQKVSVEVPKCDYCELPLHGPILTELRSCEFGHRFHSLCLSHNMGICNICTRRT